MNWIWIHLHKFSFLIPISKQFFIFPLHVKQVFFSRCDSRERGWKIVLWKDVCGRWIVKYIQTDPIEFDLFRVGNVDENSSLQAPTSIQESIQPTNVVRGCVVSLIDLVVNDSNGEENNGVDNLEDYATSDSNTWCA